MILKVCAYCRVSTDSEQQEKSFESQKSYFEREITARGNTLVKVYGDEGESGTKLNNRKQFNDMLFDAGIDVIEDYRKDTPRNRFGNLDKRCKMKHVIYEESNREPLFDEIWIKNTSRFARNTLSFEIIQILREKNVYINFIEQNLNTREMGSDFLLKIFQLFDEQDSRDKSSKVKFGMKEGAKTRGTILSNGMIYGLRYDKQLNSLNIIENEASVVREIFQLYLEGLGIRRIINNLNSQGIVTRQGKSFCHSSVRRILSNEKYCGTNVRNKYTSGNIFTKNAKLILNNESDWIIKKNHDRIEPIIDQTTFDQAQKLLHSKASAIDQKGIYKGTSEYSGLIYCGKCGSVYHSNNDEGRKFYVCKNKKQNGTEFCHNPNITLKKLIAELNKEEISGMLLAYIGQYKRMMDELIEILKAKTSQINNKEINRLNEQLNRVIYKRERYIELYADETITKRDMTNRVEILNLDIKELDEKIKIEGMGEEDIRIDIEGIYRAKEMLNLEVKRLSEEKSGIFDSNGIIRDVVKITVMPSGDIEVQNKFMNHIADSIEKYRQMYKDLKEHKSNMGNVL